MLQKYILKKKSKFINDVFSTSVVSSISKGIGLLVPIIIARLFGATKETDVFFLAYSFIMFFTMTLSTSLETILVPFIVEKKESLEKLKLFLGQIFGTTLLMFLLISAFGFLFIKPIMSFLTKFPISSLDLLKIFYLETLPVSLLVVWNSTIIANLNAHGNFIAPASSPTIRAITTIAIIFSLHGLLGIHAVPVGYSLGEFLRLIFLLINSKNRNLNFFRIIFHINKDYLSFIRVLSFQAIGLLAVGANPFIDRTMATWAQSGGVSILEYAEKIYLIPIMLISSGIFTVILPRWSGINFNGKNSLLKHEVNKTILFSIPLSILLVAPLIIFSNSIVNLFYGKGISDPETISLINISVKIYLIGVLPYLLGQFVVRALLAMKLTKGIMVISGIKTFFNVLLNLIFLRWWGIKGIVLSTTVNSTILFVILYIYFLKNIKSSNLNNKNFEPDIVKAMAE